MYKLDKQGCLISAGWILCILGLFAAFMLFLTGFLAMAFIVFGFVIGIFLVSYRYQRNYEPKRFTIDDVISWILDRDKTGKSRETKNEEDDNIFRKGIQEQISWENKFDEMNGYEFEKFIAKLFEEMGYSTRVTKQSGDHGVDVIAETPFETLAIQAKNYKNKVSNSAVQEIVAAKNPCEADKAIVVTTSDFTSSAKSLAQANGVKLVNREELLSIVDDYM